MRQHHDVCPVSIRITGQIVSVPQTIYSLNEKENFNYFIHIAHFKAEPLYASQTDNVMTAILKNSTILFKQNNLISLAGISNHRPLYKVHL